MSVDNHANIHIFTLFYVIYSFFFVISTQLAVSHAHDIELMIEYVCKGWPKKVSRFQDSSLNRIKNRLCGYISHQF